MNIITKHASRIMISKALNVQSTIKQTKTQREVSAHWLTNQTPHLPQLMFKLDPLVIPSGVTILWTPHLCSCASTRWRTRFLFEKDLFFRKGLRVTTYFCFIFKGKTNKKENPKCNSLFGKDGMWKTKSGLGGQVTYWKGTVKTVAPL